MNVRDKAEAMAKAVDDLPSSYLNVRVKDAESGFQYVHVDDVRALQALIAEHAHGEIDGVGVKFIPCAWDWTPLQKSESE